jgi:hypothetical protein
MKKFLLAVLLVATLTLSASAGDLTISGEDLTWSGSGASPTFTVSVQNPGGAVTDNVQGWSLGLWVAPESGATGTVSFNVPPLTGFPPTASVPAPPNYLFASDSSGILLTEPTSPVQVLANDIATDSGVPVPSTGANLLALSFTATAGATGVFDIFTLGDSVTGSYWVDPTGNTFAFGNVPFSANDPATPGSPVLLGTVTISQASIPEPMSLVLLASGLLGVLGYRHLQHRRQSR